MWLTRTTCLFSPNPALASFSVLYRPGAVFSVPFLDALNSHDAKIPKISLLCGRG